MDPAVVATVFGLMAAAELPDKTMIATLVMGSRSRPLLVWGGAGSALVVQVAIAVVAGRFLLLLPHRALEVVVAAAFGAGAVYLLFGNQAHEERKGEQEGASATLAPPAWRVVAAAFVVIFLGEFGDLTQLLAVNLVARYRQPAAVFVGGAAGLVTVSAAAAFGGRALTRVLPLTLLRRLSGVALLGFCAYSVVGLVGG
jgi:putative Ca2+/H+ antiporter (TMEM165/GDT1 family)